MVDSQKRILYRLGVVVLLLLAVYAATLTHDFVWDDTFIIVNNPQLERLSNIPKLFLSEDTIEDTTGYYRPVTYISFALERAIWGVNPAGYHGTNLVLHILVVLLLYAVTSALFQKERLAFAAALIFALHPVAGESVNFISSRNTLLCACFGLLSFLFYLGKKDIPSLVSFLIAIFSKEFALLLPAVFLFYDYRVQRGKLHIGRYTPFLAAIAGYLALRSYAVQKANFLDSINLSDSMAAPYLVVRYVLNMIFPFQLKVLYSVSPNMVGEVISFILLLIIVSTTIFYLRRNDEILFSIFWIFLFLLPVVNIIPLRTTTVLADRYAYFSLMGFSLLLAIVICKWSRRSITICLVVLCACYAFVDLRHTGFWKNDITLFTRMTEDAADRYEGFKNLGFSYYKRGDVERAMLNLEVADAKPGIPVKYLISDAYIFWKEGRLDKAEKSLLRVIDENPSNPEPYLLLMLIYEQKRDNRAGRIYRNKLEYLAGNVEEILTNRPFELCRTGETFMSKRQYTDAEIHLWQSLRLNPEFIPALIDMGSLKSEQGDLAGAMQYLAKAIALEPLNASAHYNLALVYRTQGRVSEAEHEMEMFRKAEAGAKRKDPTPAGN